MFVIEVLINYKHFLFYSAKKFTTAMKEVAK